MKFKGMANKIKLIIWLAIPFVLLFLPTTFFDSGQSICPSKILLETECPGCGITRSIQHAIHFDFIQSWRYNKLVVIVLPILIYLWGTTLFSLIKNTNNKKKQ